MLKKKWLGLASLAAALVVLAKKLAKRGPKKTGTSEGPAKDEPS